MSPFQMFVGDDEDPEGYFQWDLDDGTKEDMNFSNAELVFSVKIRETEEALIEKKNLLAGGDATEIEMTDPANGKFVIHIQPADTVDLQSGKYVYDIEAIFPIEGVKTLIKDSFLLREDVTKP